MERYFELKRESEVIFIRSSSEYLFRRTPFEVIRTGCAIFCVGK